MSLLISSDSTTPPGRLRPSLENLGNTCFLNCVTQALSSVDSFYEWIQDILLAQHREREAQLAENAPRSEVEISEELKKAAPMISALHEVLTTLQLPTDGTQSTSLSKVNSYKLTVLGSFYCKLTFRSSKSYSMYKFEL